MQRGTPYRCEKSCHEAAPSAEHGANANQKLNDRRNQCNHVDDEHILCDVLVGVETIFQLFR